MVNNGVRMILPVAGVQTADVVNVLGTNALKGKAFTFGVDVDQSKVYNPEFFLGSALKGIYASTSYAIEELRHNPSRQEFPQFGLQSIAQHPDVQKYLDDLKSNLIKHGASPFDAYVKTLPTGFAPSILLKDSIPAAAGDTSDDAGMGALYLEAMKYAENGQVVPGLKAGLNGNAKATYDLYGGYLEVAQS